MEEEEESIKLSIAEAASQSRKSQSNEKECKQTKRNKKPEMARYQPPGTRNNPQVLSIPKTKANEPIKLNECEQKEEKNSNATPKYSYKNSKKVNLINIT
jgi:hypothetical protein